MLKKEQEPVILEELMRGAQVMLTDKFARLWAERRFDPSISARIIRLCASALGETLDTIRYPAHWERFLKRKDCPKYMKDIVEISVHAYYPRISIPEQKPWLTFDRGCVENWSLEENKGKANEH